MADLAREAQVSVGAIYRSYSSKSDIILAIIMSDSDAMLKDIERDAERVRAGEITIAEALEAIILYRLSEEDGALKHEILAEAHRNPVAAAAISDFAAKYRAIFTELAQLARPCLTGDALGAVAEMMLIYIFGLGHRELVRSRDDGFTNAKMATRLILNALGVEEDGAAG